MSSERSKRNLERLVSLFLASVIVLVFFERISELSAIAERESVQQTLSVIRTGIQVFILKQMITGNEAELSAYENTNPMHLMGVLPAHYAGEFELGEAVTVPPGQWYYDLTAKQLVYRVVYGHIFGLQGERPELRYRLQFAGDSDGGFPLRLLAVQAGSQ